VASQHNTISTNAHIIANRLIQTLSMFILMVGSCTNIDPHDTAAVATALIIIGIVQLTIRQIYDMIKMVIAVRKATVTYAVPILKKMESAGSAAFSPRGSRRSGRPASDSAIEDTDKSRLEYKGQPDAAVSTKV
jgi:hypothetical protein